MSRAASPGTGLVYGLERVCSVWGVPRSSFYTEQRKAVDPTKPAARRRGPKPKISDENLLAAIVADLEASPFEGEGFRKVCGPAAGATGHTGLADAAPGSDAGQQPALASPCPPPRRT